jgi:lipopolysaccharide/colanic/teichoic acid biosynthesis glycosyltransferase
MSVTPMETATDVTRVVDPGETAIALRVPVSSEFVARPVPATPLRPTPLRPSRMAGARALLDGGLKRAVDIAVAGLALLLLLPLIVLTGLLVRLDSPGPAFFRCDRAGHRGRRLRMLKFRKMHNGASGRALTIDDDERFTRLGPLLAKFKLDEIPQLWHVFKGEMSLVGPRPEDVGFVEQHGRDYRHILRVKPGITGLSQIAFAEESRILDDDDPLGHYLDRLLPQKIGLDRLYARHRTVWFDLRILFWTFAAVFLRRPVAVHRHNGRMNLRRR